MKQELNAIFAIAYRDFLKFLRDKPRIAATFIFPIVFVGILGGALNANLSKEAGYSLLFFIFTGSLAQTLFQSAASGIISLIEDKENDFSQEIFVAPISRYSIITGKIVGESIVALLQGFGIILFGAIIGVPFTLTQLIGMFLVSILICFFGGTFGVLVLANLSNQRSANQVFPFIIFPQFFLAGVFSPIKELPIYLLILSRISPMTYAVDLLRSVYYLGKPEAAKAVLFGLTTNLIVVSLMSFAFLLLGTYFFIKQERNR